MKRSTLAIVILTGALLVLLGLLSPVVVYSQSIFINEIHYDNIGTDEGEFIEIAGPGGTDLTDWKIILYDGNGGEPYQTLDLGGLIPYRCAGLGLVFVEHAGIQNGSPDAIALVDNSSGTNTVVQFLSYEGVFVGTDGPATGITSVDIGVEEGSSTPVGHSLQLSGIGTVSSDFNWNAPTVQTKDACNRNQHFVATPAFKITESVPENGAVSVPSSSQVTFTFSDPVDTSIRYASGLPVAILDPTGSIGTRITSWSISPDELNLTIDISSPEDSDLAIVITDATQKDGRQLCAPFAFNYSTKSSQGTRTVSGTIEGLGALKRGGWCAQSPWPVIVALYNGPIDQGGNSVYASVSSLYEFEITYEITNVRSGTYWPYFFHDINGDGEIDLRTGYPPEMSFYDSDGDRIIDPVSIESVDISGINAGIFIDSAVEDQSMPSYFILDEAYPNPFTSRTTITYSLTRNGAVKLRIYDILGGLVTTLEDGVFPTGEYATTFDATGLAAGVYFYNVTAGDFRQTRRIVLLK